MWKVWMVFDPRRSLILIMAFGFFMVLVNHFVQLSTPRYGIWLQQQTTNTKMLNNVAKPPGG
jgi:light-harvesting complex 1 alpha chain